MMNSPVKTAALSDKELLAKLVEFKDKFYRCPWARYNEAKNGTIKLMPSERNLPVLHDDYEHMQNMIFGDKPDFGVIIRSMQELEDEINQMR